MKYTAEKFRGLLKKIGIADQHTKRLSQISDKSPLHYAFTVSNGRINQANNSDHSFRVFNNCLKLSEYVNIHLNKRDFLILFYASLLHDVAKSEEDEIKKHVEKTLREKCALFSPEEADHGVRSAYYINNKQETNKLCLYGLQKDARSILYEIISFHSTGRLHASFVTERELTLQEVLLCNLFRVADIADGAHNRVEAAITVGAENLSEKLKARAQVEQVKIEPKQIVWFVKKKTAEVQTAADMENKALLNISVILQAFGLPCRIIIVRKNSVIPKPVDSVSSEGLAVVNMASQYKGLDWPLVLSQPNLPKLYEQIVATFHKIRAEGVPDASNYVGPVILEVLDVDNDDASSTRIRSDVGTDMKTVQEYVHQWLDRRKEASDHFYFGYTHGQRIFSYRFPRTKTELNEGFKQWKGTIDQFENIRQILHSSKVMENARRAYLIIPQPIVDNPKSSKYQVEEVAPALLGIHFQVENDNHLSAFAFLRSQELSVFSVLNYLELKELMNKLYKELKKKNSRLKRGRIIMMSSLSYFDPSTVLLDKPILCKKGTSDFTDFVDHMEDVERMKEFEDLLRGYANRDYLKIETEWCKLLEKELKQHKKSTKLSGAVNTMHKKLETLAKKKQKHTITGKELVKEKQEIIEKFIEKMEKLS